MKVEEISPHGFCGGVERALRMARSALAEQKAKGAAALQVCCLHELVHSETVVESLKAAGMMFVDGVDGAPDGSILLVSAHGAAPADYAAAESRGLKVVDATCPFVAAAHERIRENFRAGKRTVVVGSPTHAEVRGYLGEPGACLPDDVRPGEVTGLVCQTTLDAGEHEGVCSATRDRQRAVRDFVGRNRGGGLAVGVVVVGSATSANTRRLADIAEDAGARAWRVGSAEELSAIDFGGLDVVGVTSGASTPEELYRKAVSRVADMCSVVKFAPMDKELK